MIWDINRVPVKFINDCLARWKENFFEANLHHYAQSSGVADSHVEPYV